MRTVWALLTIAGCGRVGFDLVGLDSDAPIARTCSHDDPFGPPIRVDFDQAAYWDFPFLSVDELELHLSLRVTSNFRLHVAKRSTVADPFGTPVELASLNMGTTSYSSSVTGDGSTVYFASNQASLGLYRATRSGVDQAFGAGTAIDELNMLVAAPGNQADPRISPDGTTLYYRTDYLPAPDQKVFVAKLGTNGVFDPPSEPDLAHVAATKDNTPFVTIDGTALYFASSRPLSGAIPGYHLWLARPGTTSGTWLPPQPITSIPLDVEIESPWLSADNCTLYFAERPAARNGEIWEARR